MLALTVGVTKSASQMDWLPRWLAPAIGIAKFAKSGRLVAGIMNSAKPDELAGGWCMKAALASAGGRIAKFAKPGGCAGAWGSRKSTP